MLASHEKTKQTNKKSSSFKPQHLTKWSYRHTYNVNTPEVEDGKFKVILAIQSMNQPQIKRCSLKTSSGNPTKEGEERL